METAQSEASSVPAKPIEGLVPDGSLTMWDNDPAPQPNLLQPKKRWPWGKKLNWVN